jgi:hypothetical protein
MRPMHFWAFNGEGRVWWDSNAGKIMTVNQNMRANKHEAVAFTFGQLARFKPSTESATRHKFVRKLRNPLSRRSNTSLKIARASTQISVGPGQQSQRTAVAEPRRTSSEMSGAESARRVRSRERVMRRVNVNFFRGRKAIFKSSNVHISFEIMDEL